MPIWSVSSVWLERMPVTHEVRGSSPLRIASHFSSTDRIVGYEPTDGSSILSSDAKNGSFIYGYYIGLSNRIKGFESLTSRQVL